MATCEIYCIRHGLAGQFGDCEDDSVRPLSDEGLKKTRHVAQRLKALEVCFDGIFSSPYLRALQTAEILRSVGLGETIETLEFLTPEDAPEPTIDWLMTERSAGKRLAIVGHNPHLSQLAEGLAFGNVTGNLVLKKAGMIGLLAPIEGPLVGHCPLFWLTPPRLLLS